MPEMLPIPTRPIIPGSQYFQEAASSYVPIGNDIKGSVANLNTQEISGYDALILALNKLLGTAPARSVRQTAGLPFLVEPVAGITANVPSDAAYSQAVEIMKGAQIPVSASPQDRVEMLTKYMQQLGIQP